MRLAVLPSALSHAMCAKCGALAMSPPTDDGFKLSPKLELERIISLQEAEKVSDLSPDSWKRHHRDKLVKLSPRRLGVRLKHALMLKSS
jgi:hypothetical protein